ncbi:uncharacterized protein DDB_G0284459-like [Schistocerca serialis cubense]|uniref:uncharacterized protein DDB_G0284459-like n=1 Tax=Schistocerca serialis cubense TaxID=2023355 RepID=UPI00214EFD83|nr:uncharacterized protein DDB_G0284459-like [Schistocerca serialis cubense]
MLTRSKQAALQEIRRWTIEDVLTVLEKNGLGDCADVIRKREVVGEMLLQLTEGKLALWKRDINQSKIRALAAFVDDLKMHPEKYLLKENCSCDSEHFPERDVSPSHVHCNSAGSNTTSWVHDKEQKLKVAAAFLSEVISQSGLVANKSHGDPLPPHRLKPPDKPPSLSRPKNFQAGVVKVTASKVFPPKPPNHSPYETTHFPARDCGTSNVPTDISESNTVSQDTKSEEDKEKIVKRATSPSTRSISQLEAYANRSHADSLLQDGVKCPNKPALLRKPVNFRPNASALHDKVSHLKSQDKHNSKPKNFPARDVQPSDTTSSSSSSDSVSQNVAPGNKQEQTVQEAAPVTLGNMSQSEATGVSSQMDLLPPDRLKSPEKSPALRYLKETKADQADTTHKKELLPKPPSHPNLPLRGVLSSSSGSDTASWDTDFEDAEPPEDIASVCSKRMSQYEAVSSSEGDVGHPGEVTSLEKSPLCSQADVQADVTSSPSDEMLLPKPPSQSSEIISTVNIGAIEAKIWAEQLDEEFYESLDGENIADVAALRAAVLNQSNEKKSGRKNVSSPMQTDKIRAENNHQNGISCTDSVTTTCAKRASLPPINDIRENHEAVRSESPPTPPPRNPTMKLNEADAVMNRLHSSSSSLREESLRQRNHFVHSPETGSAATSHQSSMTSLNNLNTGSTRNSYLHFSQNNLTFSDPDPDAEYEILDNRAHVTSDADSILSEVYESIKEQGPRNGVDEDGYYLQPDPRLPSKNDESSSDDSRHLPLPPKSKATLPDVVLPSAPPPSPPRKKSEDSSSSTTSGSGDSMSGRLGGLFRKVISRPQPLLPDHSEKASSATPELKKPCSLPPPTTRPPPPVEQRSSAFQRPLPPTPEGKKFQLPSPDKSHNITPHQTTPVSFRQMPWFHNIDRQRAEELLRNGEDGCFVVRPSTQTSNPLTLTLWYKNRIFNICIRHRKDGKYALGTEKINEQSFDSIEEMVTNYQSEKLVLYSAGERAGKVLLTNSPRRSS